MSKESPMIYARALASSELRSEVTAQERRWLHDHPLLWLRALIQLRRDVETHIGQDRLRLTRIRPTSGQTPSTEYLAEKAIRDERTARRLHFLNMVDRKKREVVVLCGGKDATPLIGDLVESMIKITTLIDEGSYTNAHDLAQSCITRWMSHE